MIAEGVETVVSAVELASQLDIELPLSQQVYEIIYKQKPVEIAIFDLQNRPAKEENWGV